MARLAGVSTATASRVLNDSGPVSDAHRRNVLQAVDALDYHPNADARTLASGRRSEAPVEVWVPTHYVPRGTTGPAVAGERASGSPE